MIVGEAMSDLIGVAGVYDASGKTIGDVQPVFDLAERQNAAVR